MVSSLLSLATWILWVASWMTKRLHSKWTMQKIIKASVLNFKSAIDLQRRKWSTVWSVEVNGRELLGAGESVQLGRCVRPHGRFVGQRCLVGGRGGGRRLAGGQRGGVRRWAWGATRAPRRSRLLIQQGVEEVSQDTFSAQGAGTTHHHLSTVQLQKQFFYIKNCIFPKINIKLRSIIT